MQTWLSAAVLVIGLVLMAIKIYADSEPGAIPLALVLLGTVWLVVSRRRARRERGERSLSP